MPQWSVFGSVLWLRIFSELFLKGVPTGLASCNLHVPSLQRGLLSSVCFYTLILGLQHDGSCALPSLALPSHHLLFLAKQ